MSYWCRGNPDHKFDKTNYSIWKLANLLANKSYKNVHLVTDSIAYSTLKDFKWASVDLSLDQISPTLKPVHILGKLHAYRVAANRGEHFIHIDGDVFLWKRLPSYIEEADLVAQMPQGTRLSRGSDNKIINTYRHCLRDKPVEMDIDVKYSFNAGILGGRDVEFMKYYSDTVIAMVENPANLKVWQSMSTMLTGTVVEEWMYAACALHKGKKVTTIIEKDTHNNIAYELGYTHLMDLKYNTKVVANIINRVAQEPYDLEPRTNS